jgi:outer membrane protein assembly factor BamA
VWVVLLAAAISWGCARAPDRRFNLQSVTVTGNSEIDDDEIEERIASRETPKLLGLFSGVIYDYETFNRFVLERDLQRIERLYQDRGFYRARARAAHVFRRGNNVRVEIVVEEGAPVLVRRVDVHGADELPRDLASELRSVAVAELALGTPFVVANLERAAASLLRVLADRGYARAQVKKRADVNPATNEAAVAFWIEPFEPAKLGAITLEGLEDLPEERVRGALGLEPGTPYSQAELDESERAVRDLGVFSSVTVQPQLAEAEAGPDGVLRVPIHVKLTKGMLRSVHAGGGLQVDTMKSDVHLSLGWEDQSFLGGMRKLEVALSPGAVLYPTRFPSFEAPERLLPQGKFRSALRQPGLFSGRMNLILTGQVAAYPVLLSSERDAAAPILGYVDYRASVTLERTYHRAYAALSHNVQLNVPFTYKGARDPALERVVVSYPALYTSLDLRDSPLRTRRGLFVANQLEVAGVGGDARDVKLQPEVRAYLPLSRRLTLAARGSLGMLLGTNYGSTTEANALTGQPGAGVDRAAWVRDIQLMYLRGFFGGGPGSNRGYGLREIGPHGVVPFYNHGQSLDVPSVDCSPGAASYVSAVCDLPLGGLSLWEANVELRYPISGDLTGDVFLDAADVSARKLSFRWNRPHLSAGLGLRYDTPVGPVRFDVGYRIPGLQAPAGAADEGAPAEVFGLPLAASFGIGEAF